MVAPAAFFQKKQLYNSNERITGADNERITHVDGLEIAGIKDLLNLLNSKQEDMKACRELLEGVENLLESLQEDPQYNELVDNLKNLQLTVTSLVDECRIQGHKF